MNNNLQGDTITAAIDILNEERVVAYPTETVFSVGYNPDGKITVMRLLELKQRPVDKGLTLIAANYEQLEPYIDDTTLTDAQRGTIFSRWPDPATFVSPVPATTPHWLTGRFGSLAVQIIDHPSVVALCRTHGKPLVSTSASLSGLSPYRTVDEVRAQSGAAFPVVPGETGGCLDPSETRSALTGELFRQG